MNSETQNSVLGTVLAATNRDATDGESDRHQGGQTIRATIHTILDSGEIIVEPLRQPDCQFNCDVLESAFPAGTRLEIGDVVLAITPISDFENGCVIGRVVRYKPREGTTPLSQLTQQTPRHIVIEATDQVSLKCGDAALDLRNDGKVMIRGKDVLTRAKRTQRIKGGTVAIN